MNNQKVENQRKEGIDVTKRRRFLQKAGIAAPVILTFTSPTAFGGTASCLSQFLSGGSLNHTVIQSCKTGTYTISGLNTVFAGNGSAGTVNYSDSVTSLLTGGPTGNVQALFAASGSHTTECTIITAYVNCNLDPTVYPDFTSAQILGLYTASYPHVVTGSLTFTSLAQAVTYLAQTL
jgi:hypothetical protein